MLFTLRRPYAGKKRIGGLAALLMLLTACGTGSASNSDGHTLTIGLALSQSGALAPYDTEPGNAALLRFAEVNAEGGINGAEIKTVWKDVRSDPDTVGTVVTEFISEGVDLIVLPCDADLMVQGATLAQAAKIPAISACAGDPKVADTTTYGDYVFTAHVGTDVEGTAGANWAWSKGWKSAYVLQDQSLQYTKSVGTYFKAEWAKIGGALVGEGAFPGGDNVNVSGQISSLKALPTQPDFIYIPSWNPGAGTAIRQLREAGIEIPIVGPAALDGGALLDLVGPHARDIYYTGFACYVYCTGVKSTGLDHFVSAYKTEYGSEPASGYTFLGYILGSVIVDAAKSATSFGGPDLKAALESGVKETTPVGDVTYFSSTCHKILDFPMLVLAVNDGATTFVDKVRVPSVPDVGDGNTCVS